MSDAAQEHNGPDREFLNLLWDLCEQNLSEQSAERLNELLRADAQYRRILIEFMQMTAGLEWEHSGLSSRAPETATSRKMMSKFEDAGRMDPHAAAQRQPDEKPMPSRSGELAEFSQIPPRPHGRISQRVGPFARWMRLDQIVSTSRATAAMLLLGTLCAGLMVAAVVTAAVMRANSTAGHVSPPPFVAKLTGAHHLRWADEATSIMVDQLLTEGQAVEIDSGWAEISFKSGARLVLEGPAKLQIQKADSARLVEGKVATDEMARKVGFTLDTPTGRVTDLGAEFGVAVDSDRTMEVDVFAGTAEVRPVVNGRTGGVGPAERLTANQSIRSVSPAADPDSKTTLERLARSNNHFVRTMRSKSFLLGSQCIGRAERDVAKGTVSFMRDPTPNSGRAARFSFYNVHADVDRWITPIILAFDRSTGTYRVTGIGQSVLNLGSGLQSVPFELIAGSADLQAGVHTFGFYHGTIDKTGKATSASLGPLDYDDAPEKLDPANPLASEARWVFVPDGTSLPVQLRLDLEFTMTPRPGQVPLWSGNERFPKQRVYSGRLEIIVEPNYPPTTTRDFVAQTAVGRSDRIGNRGGCPTLRSDLTFGPSIL